LVSGSLERTTWLSWRLTDVILTTDDSATYLENKIVWFRKALKTLSDPVRAMQLQTAKELWKENTLSGIHYINSVEGLEDHLAMVAVYLDLYTFIFKEGGGLARACDMLTVEPSTVRESLREELYDAFIGCVLHDENLFSYAEMIEHLEGYNGNRH